MDINRKLVEDFYHEIWNAGDEGIAHRILASDLEFRGSTGPSKKGVVEFLAYTRLIKAALSDYECIIDALVCEGELAFAKTLFRGKHTGTFFGVPATNHVIAWAGAALFRIEDERISSIWVLGDVDGLKAQLGLSKSMSP